MLLKDFLKLTSGMQGVVVQHNKDCEYITDYALRHQDKLEIVHFRAWDNIVYILVKEH